MSNETWTHGLARCAARPLIGRGGTPNRFATLRLPAGVPPGASLAAGPARLHAAPPRGGALWMVSAPHGKRAPRLPPILPRAANGTGVMASLNAARLLHPLRMADASAVPATQH